MMMMSKVNIHQFNCYQIQNSVSLYFYIFQ
jgi:hypothetical protein